MGNNSSTSSANKRKKEKTHSQVKNKSNDDRILACVIEFVQSAECSMFVDGFIDEHCLIFDTNNSKMNNEYIKIHLEYRQMVETLLISKLSKLGLTVKQFTEAMQKVNHTKINSDICQCITAVDDFKLFQNLMIQRNIELEQEAMKYLSQQNTQNPQNINRINENNMTEQQQIEWAVSESIAIQKQQQQQIMQSLQQQHEIVPSAPFLSREPSHTPKNSEAENNDNATFDVSTNINISEPKQVSLKPLKLKKDENVSFEGIKNDEVLPALTAASIQNIKRKQSSKYNESILKQKRMILSRRKQRRDQEIKNMQAEGQNNYNKRNIDINKLNVSKQSNLPPLHKSLFAKINGEGNEEFRNEQ